ncbi:MAG: glycosyltransferase [Candidatus Omnitrophica bacterium]|nr:glycosyltransferase [Candidatus Omnitrophota bacterium]
MNKRIIIFYISEYSGHFHAACAIESGLRETKKDLNIEKVNALDYTNPILGKIINKAYLEIIKKKPELWGSIYDSPEVVKKTKKAREALHKYNMSKIRRLIEKHSPEAVFCTQAMPCGMVADYKRSCGKDVKLIGVLTDHAPHSFWIYDEVDVYAVPSDGTRDALAEKGVPREKIVITGIPVDPKFCAIHDPSEIRAKYGLEKDLPTVLIMGGSQGLGEMELIVKSLLKDESHDYQLIIVAGSNKRLYSRLKRLGQEENDKNMCVLSFDKNIEELMEVSQIIVSKAGGMTSAEAMVKHLPMLIVNPIPGHERMNTNYLTSSGAAVEVKDLARVPNKINELFDSKGALQRMRKKAEKLSRPESALEIAKLALR